MTYDPKRHHRRSIRLHGYDYALSGAYFVHFVAQNRVCLFSTIQDGVMLPSPAGDMLQTIWQSLPALFPMSRWTRSSSCPTMSTASSF